MSSTFSVLKLCTWRWAPPPLSPTALPAAEHAGWLPRRLRWMFDHFSWRGFLGTDWSNPSYSNPVITHASEDCLNPASRRSAP